MGSREEASVAFRYLFVRDTHTNVSDLRQLCNTITLMVQSYLRTVPSDKRV